MATTEDICALCGHEGLVEHGSVKSYALMRCPVCGFIEAPGVTAEQLADFYERDYFEGKSAFGYGRADAAEADMIAEALPASHEWVISHYLDPLAPRSVLEVGPGMGGGWIKRFASESGLRVQAVEISSLASDRMHDAGIPAFNGRIEDFRPDAPFDLVIGIEVIEHVADPVSFARAVADALEPGGHLLLTTGNARSITARRAGLGWYYLDPPAHLSYFDDRNIARLLRSTGFDQVRVRRFGFKWVELAARYRVTAALTLIGAANYASGMIVTARKAS